MTPVKTVIPFLIASARRSILKFRSNPTLPVLFSIYMMTNSANSNNVNVNSVNPGESVRKVVIVGSGPAAHTAAIYAARANLSPVLFEGFMAGGVAAGGQLTTTTEVENFPGFPEGIMGPELMARCREQAAKFGTEMFLETVDSVDLSKRPFKVSSSDRTFLTETVIIATGATAKRMDIPGCGDGEFWQRGVSACAVCDGALPMFRNRPVLVIGGGDSAMEEASFLTKFASRVYIVHRRDELRASKIMQQRALSNPKIEFLYSHVVTRVQGDKLMQTATIKDLKSGEERDLEASGLFFAIGHEPNVKFLSQQLETDEQVNKNCELLITNIFSLL
jgi:thioredoxin reductase (NADPH)